MNNNQNISTRREETLDRIKTLKEKIGKDLLIFAHFYQNEDIVYFADFVGDSLQLANEASRCRDVPYIVFCSVSFMAEMARILCSDKQKVLTPDIHADCPLAEMADIDDVEDAWKQLSSFCMDIIPIVYVNSMSELKAFCGKNNGAVCTSANVKKIFQWVIDGKSKILFFPDENLGRNTAYSLGIGEDEIFVWDPHGHNNLKELKNKRVILWKGFCYVHKVFLPSQVEKLKKQHDGLKVIVHPECPHQLCSMSDYYGSTSFIKKTVEESPSGSAWAIGTEWNFVNRLAQNNPDKKIFPLAESICWQMSQITSEKLLSVLEGLLLGEERGRITVKDEIAYNARLALNRMLEIG